MKRDADFEQLARYTGEWMRGEGPESDIVISTRVRLARNLADFPFIRRCSEDDRLSIERSVRARMETIADQLWESAQYVDLEPLSEIDRQLLVERQLISREIAESDGSRAVAFDASEGYSVMINEEDHLRIQVMRSGLDMENTWQKVNRIDNMLEEVMLYAFHPRYGYLTACPTNVGTGLRVSVMLHLPALVITEQMDRVFRSMQRINVTVRGLYGEGSQYTGDFYQVSNQVTLGYTESELLDLVGKEVAPRIIEYERKAREALLKNNRDDLHDEVSRAMGILSTARKISSEETMHHLSKIRLGISMGLIEKPDVKIINQLFLQSQSAHLQKLQGRILGTAERHARRASFLQQHLSGKDDATWN
ncbi:protein arginine kinase [Stieleria sp. JC731]|uniref:protein arginine kinase n=1 Tax=Pirellulaceae TaxID=2691357 RepID=UPI001E324EF3|nr:protein arginine kinase [Stieleria sp. JC731]MCC9600525.1 protein arginine kinase [Stieleria sp. JC731]